MTTPEQIEAVARVRLMIHSAVEDDARAWELTDDELAVIADAAINAMRPSIRAEALEEAAKVVEEDMKSGCQCHECMRRYIDAKAIRALKDT